MTLTREEAIERLKQNKAAAEYYAGQSRINAEIENSLKDSEAFDMAIEALSERTGEWIDKGNWMGIECSRCKCHSRYVTPFCPQCGARMKGADNE